MSMRTTNRISSPWFPGQRLFSLVDGGFYGVVEYVEFDSELQEYIAFVPDEGGNGATGLNFGDSELDSLVAIGQRYEPMGEARLEAEAEALLAEEYRGYGGLH